MPGLDQNAGALGPNPFEAMDARLRQLAGRIHNGRDGYGRGLEPIEFHKVAVGFKAVADQLPSAKFMLNDVYRDKNDCLHWGNLSLSACADRRVRIGNRSYMIPQFTHASVSRILQPSRRPHSVVDLCTGALPVLLSADHVHRRVNQRGEITMLNELVLQSMGAYGAFFVEMAAKSSKFFTQDPMPVALPTDDGFFAGHIEPVSDAIPSAWFKSSRTVAERREGSGVKRRMDRTVDPFKYAMIVSTFYGLWHTGREVEIMHRQLSEAFEHQDIIAAINKVYQSHVRALEQGAPLDINPATLPQHTRDRIKREVVQGGNVEAFVQKINTLDLSDAFKIFSQRTAEAARFLGERGASLPDDAHARAAKRAQDADRARKIALLKANGL